MDLTKVNLLKSLNYQDFNLSEIIIYIYCEVILMSTKVVELKTVKVGKYIVLDGEASKVTSLTTSSPGKHGAAKARLEAVGIFDGQKRSLVKPVDTKVEVPILDKRIGQILAIMGDQVQIMDLETYETMELAIPDEFADDIRGAVGTDLGVEYIVAMGNMKIMRTKKV